MKALKILNNLFKINSKPGFSINKSRAWFYSEEGEDVILKKIFNKELGGFYVDISNFDSPFSNTYFLYMKGWKGMNVYCQPIDKSVLPLRERDINIFKIISTKTEIKTMSSSDDSAFDARNSFHKNDKDSTEKEIKAEATTLELIFKSYLPSNAGYTTNSINLVNIDSPGNEAAILQSNNWKYYRPKVILVNDIENQYQFNNKSIAFNILSKNNYAFFAKTTKYSFFREINYMPE